MEALSTTKAGYMTFTEAWKKEIWQKGLLIESRYELKLVAGIATGALVKSGSRSEVPAQVKVAAYRHCKRDFVIGDEDINFVILLFRVEVTGYQLLRTDQKQIASALDADSKILFFVPVIVWRPNMELEAVDMIELLIIPEVTAWARLELGSSGGSDPRLQVSEDEGFSQSNLSYVKRLRWGGKLVKESYPWVEKQVA
ncbi:hypothetical protein Tco_0625602 [Tanacetum coccineum]|uniref:DUF4365 domain-containing protein n=1 Tax=Tanacetum coccineum TaxID=301880 RepID=A0ABQ4WHD0_9ASTR